MTFRFILSLLFDLLQFLVWLPIENLPHFHASESTSSFEHLALFNIIDWDSQKIQILLLK